MSKMRKLLLKDSVGQSMVEFAVLLPLLLAVLFGIAEFGRAIMTKNVLNTACREGARLASVSPQSDSLAVQARVMEVLQAANIKSADIQEIRTQFDLVQESVTVTVRTSFHDRALTALTNILSLLGGTTMASAWELEGKAVIRYTYE